MPNKKPGTSDREHDLKGKGDSAWLGNPLLRAVWNTIDSIAVVLDEKGYPAALNDSAKRLAAYDEAKLSEKTLWELLLDEAQHLQARELFEAALHTQREIRLNMPIRSPDGERFIDWTVVPLPDRHILLVGRDATREHDLHRSLRRCEEDLERLLTQRISILENQNRKLSALSVTDHLTGLYNRRYFDEQLNQILKNERRENRLISLLLCDIDHFKNYNDTYGHPAGDKALQAVAHVLRHCLHRKEDIVARYGGEEFIAILPETDSEGAIKVAQCIQQKLDNEHIDHLGSNVASHLTLSIGVVTAEVSTIHDGKMLIDLADRQLYEAKRRGRNTVMFARYVEN